MKRFIALAICVVFTLTPLSVLADVATPTDIATETDIAAPTNEPVETQGAILAAIDYTMDFSVNGLVNWNNGNYINYLTTDDSGTNWSWTYQNKMLTLDGLTFSTTNQIAMKLPAGATLVIHGDNTLTSTYNARLDSYGIYCLGGLTVNGGGTLNATGGTSTGNQSYGIYIDSSNITIDSGSVTARGGTSNSDSYVDAASYGIYTFTGNITVNDATLTAIGGNAYSNQNNRGSFSWGAHGNVTVNGGTLVATGGTCNSGTRYYGISRGIQGDITVHSGSVTATGGAVTGIDKVRDMPVLKPERR